MPFLLPLLPIIGTAVAGGAASAAVGAGINAVENAASGGGPANAAPDPFANKNVQNAQQGFKSSQAAGASQASKATQQTQGAYGQQQQLAQALQGQGGIQNQSSVYNQQQGLANQLALNASGQGAPSIAQAQLANTTGANVANQAALMAGQRGAGSNVGLIARNAGIAGSNAQQQSAGQAAVLRAQEQQAATQQLQGQQAMLGALATQQVGQQTGATQALNQNSLQNQQLVNQNAQANQQAALTNQSQILNAQQGRDTNVAAGQRQDAAQTHELTKGLASGVGSAITSMTGPSGTNAAVQNAAGGGGGAMGNSMANMAQGGAVTMPGIESHSSADNGKAAITAYNSNMANLKENYSDQKSPRSKIGRHFASTPQNFKVGGEVPGKPAVPGNKNTQKNDTVPAMLSPGEVVLPRSVTQSADPKASAAKFVEALMSKKKKAGKK